MSGGHGTSRGVCRSESQALCQAAFRNRPRFASHASIRFQLALVWSTILRSPFGRATDGKSASYSSPAKDVHHSGSA